MKREVAIAGLKVFRKEFSGYEPNEEMFDMAIKALEQEPTTKNDLGVDCISRQEVLRLLANSIGKTNTYLQTEVLRLPSVTPQLSSGLEKNSKKLEKNFVELDCISRAEMLKYQQYLHGKMSNEENHKLWEFIKQLPSVTPQEPQTFKWCDTCKEYDQEKHCCHRWSKVIRDTVKEMKQEQEPILDKIRAEFLQLKTKTSFTFVNIDDILKLIDKYKAESEET